MLKLRKNKKGFTLVELIVVIAIMAVLAGTVAGVTVAQLNKQTNNTAKTEAQTLASDFKNFMIDYTLPTGKITSGTESAPEKIPGTNEDFTMVGEWNRADGINTVGELTYAVYAFVDENKQGDNIEVITVDGTKVPAAPTDNNSIKGNNKTFKAGEHKFYAVVYKDSGDSGKLKVRFCCLQKGTGQNQFPFADYTYSDVLADK